uniref:Uncharacterized protein n=1 Tax=Oryza rufipogon TaxID=4529 RepID=A0A0E0QKV7_ORYRU
MVVVGAAAAAAVARRRRGIRQVVAVPAWIRRPGALPYGIPLPYPPLPSLPRSGRGEGRQRRCGRREARRPVGGRIRWPLARRPPPGAASLGRRGEAGSVAGRCGRPDPSPATAGKTAAGLGQSGDDDSGDGDDGGGLSARVRYCKEVIASISLLGVIYYYRTSYYFPKKYGVTYYFSDFNDLNPQKFAYPRIHVKICVQRQHGDGGGDCDTTFRVYVWRTDGVFWFAAVSAMAIEVIDQFRLQSLRMID